MKKSILLLTLSLCIAAVSSPAEALTLSLNPSNQTINSGDDVFLDLVVSGLTKAGPDSLGGFEASVCYDETLFEFSNVTFGTFLGNPDFFEFETDAWFDDSTPGEVYLYEVSMLLTSELDALQGKSFTLASIQFSSIDWGVGSFELENVVLSDAFGYDLSPIYKKNASVTSSVAPVPEPATILLLGTGLVGLVRFRKRVNKN